MTLWRLPGSCARGATDHQLSDAPPPPELPPPPLKPLSEPPELLEPESPEPPPDDQPPPSPKPRGRRDGAFESPTIDASVPPAANPPSAPIGWRSRIAIGSATTAPNV